MTPSFDVMLVTDDGPDIRERAAAALQRCPPGRVALQLRNKELGAADLLTLATDLRAITRARGIPFFVNDRVDIALLVKSDGVQLPESGLSPSVARTLLGPSALIGASRHDAAGVAQAFASGASFVTLSPVHAVANKNEALGYEHFSAIARGAAGPVYALGGVRRDDVAKLRAAGARGVAVIRAVWAEPNPGEALQQLLSTFSASVVAPREVRG